MAVNKVIYNGTTLIDLTGDTVSADQLKKGITAHDKSGAAITGTCTHDVDSSDANATVSDLLSGTTAYARGAKITGTMKNNACYNKTITTKAQEVTIPVGFHDGSGVINIASTEQAKIIAGNIKKGVTILGVTGSCEPSSDVTVHSKSVTPKATAQTVLPDDGYDYLSQVTVAAVPYTETDNSAGGKTVTIL